MIRKYSIEWYAERLTRCFYDLFGELSQKNTDCWISNEMLCTKTGKEHNEKYEVDILTWR